METPFLVHEGKQSMIICLCDFTRDFEIGSCRQHDFPWVSYFVAVSSSEDCFWALALKVFR